MTQQKNSGSVLVWEGSKRSEEPSQRSSSEANRLSTPDPEVPEKARRRRFSARYKLKILEQADRCRQAGEVGALLRREGLYWSNLQTWRRQREEGSLQGLSPKKRGRKSAPQNPLAGKVKALERENKRLQRKLQRAEIMLDIQKKASELLGIPLETVEREEDD
jgi:transposase